MVLDDGARAVALIRRANQRRHLVLSLHQKLVDSNTAACIHTRSNRSQHLQHGGEQTEPWRALSQHHVEAIVIRVLQLCDVVLLLQRRCSVLQDVEEDAVHQLAPDGLSHHETQEVHHFLREDQRAEGGGVAVGTNMHAAGRDEDVLVGGEQLLHEGFLVGQVVAGRRAADRVEDEGEEVAAQRAGVALAHQRAGAAVRVRRQVQEEVDKGFSLGF